MKKFNVDLKLELSIEFSDLELAENYLVGEDAEFAQCFYTNDHIGDFLETFSVDFVNHMSRWGDVDIEGFATFVQKGNTYTSVGEEYGTIIVTDVNYGLEVDYIHYGE